MEDKKLNVLVVDDSITVRSILVDELKALGYAVQAAASAEEAQEVLDKSRTDIMFLDLNLPGITGLEYLKKIQAENKDIIVVVMTGYESPQTAVEAIEKGAYDYIVKPIQPGHLELIIKRALKRYQIEQERKIAIDRRLRALTDFMETSKNREEDIKELREEVNNLLSELGRPPKYKES